MPPSGSESFDLLHDRVRRWIWDRGWTELRDVQEVAIRTLRGGENDVIITAATAAGKTEAAFFPICSSILSGEPAPGVKVLYVGPLKALINDQWRRLDDLCESLEIPVHRWHGDVTASARQKLVREPDGILLITPESLEALFVRRGTDVGRIFAGLQYVVIDELHAFIGIERGMQLQSLLHRLERVLGRRVRRVGLSATLGDMTVAADFLRPPNGRAAAPLLVQSSESGTAVRLRLLGFKRPLREPVQTPAAVDQPDAEGADGDDGDETARSIAEHLFRNLRGSNNLVFANSRGNVEAYTDRLVRMCKSGNYTEEFFAHHGSLSRELRTAIEQALKSGDRPLTVICTSTLEMGIDIGAITSVAQIGPPPSVASLRQRLGRSGRRGEPAVLRLYIEESSVTERASPQDAIRATLVHSIAMVNLLLEKWVEPPLGEMVHGSTFVQQLLSLIAQYGGVTAADAYAALCESGPFQQMTRPMFRALLRTLAAHDLIRQEKNGELLHGLKGERLVNHYEFYTAFVSPDDYRLMAGGTQLGRLPLVNPVTEGSFLIFAGRRWRVLNVDQEKRVIDVAPAGGGRVPIFDSGAGGRVHDRVRREMFAIYTSDDMPAYLDKAAGDLLQEGRRNFARYQLHRTHYITAGDGTFYFPWYGDIAMNTLVQQLLLRGLEVSAEGPAIVAGRIPAATLRDAITECERERPVDTVSLAAAVKNRIAEKWEWSLDDATLCASYASRELARLPAAAFPLGSGAVGE